MEALTLIIWFLCLLFLAVATDSFIFKFLFFTSLLPVILLGLVLVNIVKNYDKYTA